MQTIKLIFYSGDVWTKDDINLFIEKFLTHPNDFTLIASFFVNKTVRDIVGFYSNFKYHMKLEK